MAKASQQQVYISNSLLDPGPHFNSSQPESYTGTERSQPNLKSTRKIFVGGLSTSTTKSHLTRYFQYYGLIEDCIVMVDKDNKPRGFGFVTFTTSNAVNQVFESHEHFINGKLVECKRAVPKEAFTGQPQPNEKQTKNRKSNEVDPAFSQQAITKT